MARQAALSVTNNFSKGLITEATGLNFPENACTQTTDCIFNYDGSVQRRLGWDFEAQSTTKNINRTNSAVNTYLWRNVAGDGNTTLVVLQVGPTLYFYLTSGTSVSSGALSTTITMTPVSGAPVPDQVEAQFCDGNGLLFVTHPYCDPFYVNFNVTSQVATATTYTLMQRDFEGAVADPNATATRPAQTLGTYTASSIGAANVSHVYNLFNQGWTNPNLVTWNATQATLPSNADVMWQFFSAANPPVFTATNAQIASVVEGNSTAPNGAFIMPVAGTTRNASVSAAAGFAIAGIAETSSGFQRPTTCAFFEGRVFYAGVNFQGFNSKIYFSQIVDVTQTVSAINQYGFCYQQNDPTAKDLFDLLPSDGGVLSIPEAGTIYKMISVPGGLAIFAANGVWFLTGSTGIGFTANDFSIQKISLVQTLSATSFINVLGYPMWWNTEGIYMMGIEGSNSLPTIKSLTYTTIKAYYDLIPLQSKKYARGFFNYVDGHAYWLFRSVGTNQVTAQYEFDTVLNFNTRTGAFYPWTQPSSNDGKVTVNALVICDSGSGISTQVNVIDGVGDQVIDAATDIVVAFPSTGISTTLNPKFLTSWANAGTYSFTFSEVQNANFLDWFRYDTVGKDFTSSLVSGFKLRGQGMTKWQSNWVNVFSKINQIPITLGPSGSVQYYFQSAWDYAIIPSGTGRWSTQQLVTHSDPNAQYSNFIRRLKCRGHGKVMQFAITSLSGQPFYIIGWSSYDTANIIP